MSFPYFINKTAPVSGVQSLMDYDVTFIGDIGDGEIVTSTRAGATFFEPNFRNVTDAGGARVMSVFCGAHLGEQDETDADRAKRRQEKADKNVRREERREKRRAGKGS